MFSSMEQREELQDDQSRDRNHSGQIDEDNFDGEDNEDQYDEEGEDYEYYHLSEDELLGHKKPRCLKKLEEKLQTLMIEPKNPKLRVFHLILAFTFYVDVLMTSFLISNYTFQIGKPEEEDYLNHRVVFYYIILIEGIDIILSFFKIQVVDVVYINEPADVALQYVTGHFLTDLVSVLPYNLIWP